VDIIVLFQEVISMFIVNVEGAVYSGDKWLIIKRSAKEKHAGGTLSLVGGKVDNESSSVEILERTVKREILEEVGIEIMDNLHYVYSSLVALDTGTNFINIVFLCTYKEGTAYCKSPDEVEAVYWMTFDEIMNHPNTPPWTKESVIRAEEIRKRLDQ
jgi:8-oxo-dGTP pyrophosphatase MutT (NUDIX family)